MDEERIEALLREGIKELMARDRPGVEAVNEALRTELSGLEGDEYSLLTSVMGSRSATDLGLNQPLKEFELHLARVERHDLAVDTGFPSARLAELKPMLKGEFDG